MKNRILTGLAAAALVVALVSFLPAVALASVIAMIFAVGGYEWASLSTINSRPLKILYALVLLGLMGAGIHYFQLLGEVNVASFMGLMHLAGVFWAIVLLWVMSYPGSAAIWSHPLFIGCMGVIVIVPPVLALVYLLQFSMGNWLVFYLVALVSSADTGAYFFGKFLGKKKLCPKVSPGKSWMGLVGGLIASSAFSLAWYYLSPALPGLSLVPFVLVGIVTVLFSVLGDLMESMVKRQAGKKDSGSILPGHGGIMDRLDSMTAAAPIYLLLLLLIMGQQ
ncbi:MAG: phosphatidate cytidylyltransferase [Cellvibrionales bacterium]|nr:phosphatidate cytidylyltransferase [Cellvibrionales bacterium]